MITEMMFRNENLNNIKMKIICMNICDIQSKITEFKKIIKQRGNAKVWSYSEDKKENNIHDYINMLEIF